MGHVGAPQLHAGLSAQPEPTWAGSASVARQAQGTGCKEVKGARASSLSYKGSFSCRPLLIFIAVIFRLRDVSRHRWVCEINLVGCDQL